MCSCQSAISILTILVLTHGIYGQSVPLQGPVDPSAPRLPFEVLELEPVVDETIPSRPELEGNGPNEFQDLPALPTQAVSRSNQKLDDQNLLQPYLDRVAMYDRADKVDIPPQITTQDVWWFKHIAEPLGLKSKSVSISLDDAVTQSLIHAPQILIAAAEPVIRETSVVEEASQFDWTAFWESKYDRANDPIGSTLTTGNDENRFRQQELYSSNGIKRKNRRGGEFEMTQRLGYLANNSRFLIPQDQGSARIEMNYRHPLWRNSGTQVNESTVLLARIDHRVANDQLRQRIQTHLVDVTEAYWNLYLARSELLLRLKLFEGANKILKQLEGRAQVDALNRQVIRAKAAVANRQAEISRATASIKNAESRLRLLVHEPTLMQTIDAELRPTEPPTFGFGPVRLGDAIATALHHRPDIASALRELRTTNVRLGVAKNDVLPKLDLLVGSYVSGLDDNSDFVSAWFGQFKEGAPGYNVGVEFEVPLGNRAAIARQRRREVEVERALHKFRLVVETALHEVELAVREVDTTSRELTSRFQSMSAASNEQKYLIDRWQTLPGMDDSVTFLLEDLLDSQERLAAEEISYSKAQFAHAVATVKLKQAVGTLFQIQNR